MQSQRSHSHRSQDGPHVHNDVQLGWLAVQTRKPLIVFGLREAANGALLESRILQVVYFLLVAVATFCLGKWTSIANK
jgi:hypothetical protein